jgi:hypothetical protein
VRTVGTVSNRDGIGARVTVVQPDGRRLLRVVKSGSSYCSQSELPVTFGVEKHSGTVTVEVKWPSGRTDVVNDAHVNNVLTIQEGMGAVSATPVRFAAPAA